MTDRPVEPTPGAKPGATPSPVQLAARAPAEGAVVAAAPEDVAVGYLLRLAQVLHAFGAPAHRLEELLTACSKDLGVHGHFFSSPTSILVAIGEGRKQHTFLLRVEPGEVDLGKLVEFDETVDRVHATYEGRDPIPDAIPIEEAEAELERIAAAPPRFGPLWTTLGFGGASGSAAVFFGGGLREVATSFFLGVITGAIASVTGRRSATARVFEPIAAFVCAFLSLAVAAWWAPMSDSIVLLAALIVLVPGLSLTVGMTELATRHLMSGTARLAGAMSVFAMMGFGVAFGRAVGLRAFPDVAGALPIEAFPEPYLWGALFVGALSFATLFQARPKEWPWVLGASFAGVLASRAGAVHLGAEIGAFTGAFAVGLFGNAYARHMQRPASLPILPGILMLVPGSLGFRSITAFLADEHVAGLGWLVETLLVAASLVGGMLAANVFYAPKRSL